MKQEEQEYCRDCQKRTWAYTRGRGLWLHTGDVERALYQFKFYNKRSYGEIFGKELARCFGEQLASWQIEEIIPIPLHFSKKRQRGYNQAEILARVLGQEAALPVNTKVVIRLCKTKPQKGLDNRERVTNLRGAFGVSKTWQPKKAVLLIDDIYTTGNTIHNVAKLLQKAGVEKVYFLTMSIGQEA